MANKTMPKNNAANAAPKSGKPTMKRRRRRSGVPAALVALLVVVSLFFGGLIGFIGANSTNTYREDLEVAKARISELENTLTMIGYSEDAEWVFDDTDLSDEFSDLSGFSSNSGNEVLWNDSNLSDNMLNYTGEPVAVAEFDGGEVMSNEVIDPYNEALNSQIFGFGSSDDVSGDLMTQVLQELVAEKIVYNKAAEMGLTELSEADISAIEAEAQASYAEQKEFYAYSVDTGDMSEQEADAALDDFMANTVGVTATGIAEEMRTEYWKQKLYDAISADVTVSEEEIQAAYEDQLEYQQEMFTQYRSEYEYAVMSEQTIVYQPEGFRYIKHIMLPFTDDDTAEQVVDLTDQIAQLNPETDMEQISALQTQLDSYYADLEAQAESILAELNAGADFDALVEQYGADEGMNYEPVKTNGYAVAADSTMWSQDFVEGCMMLDTVGAISTPVRTVSGVHIIKYVADVPAGAVPLESVRSQIEADVLTSAKDLAYETQVAEWLEAANVQYYPERLQ